MHFWLRAARKAGLLLPPGPAEAEADVATARLKDDDTNSDPTTTTTIPPAKIQTAGVGESSAAIPPSLPDNDADAGKQRRSVPPPPPPPLRDTMDASQLYAAVRDSVAEEEASFVKSREKKEASSLPSEAKKLQWLQPYIKGVRCT